MPAIRSPKGKAPDSDTATASGKGKPRAARPKKTNVDPCEICGVTVSRKADIPRHAKIHDPDAEKKKLPCSWEGCSFRTLQKSNLETHLRRHVQDKSYTCPDCQFGTCDPASLIRHRRRLHGYVPRTPAPQKIEKPYERLPANVGREIEGDSSLSSVASQFSRFSSGAEASTPGSSSSRRRPISPSEYSWSSDSSPPSPSPSPSPSKFQSQSQLPSPTSSQLTSPRSSPSPPPHSRPQRPLPRFRSFSPASSSGESEVSPSPSTTPITATTPDRELTPEGSYPTVLIMIPPPVHRSPEVFCDSLLLAQDPYYRKLPHPFGQSPSELLERHWALTGSKNLGYQYPTEEIYDRTPSMSMGDGMNYYSPPPPPPPISPYANTREQFGDEMMGQPEGLDKQSFFGIPQFERTIQQSHSHYNNYPVEGLNSNSPIDGRFFCVYCGCPPGSGTMETWPICDRCGLKMFPYTDIIARLGGNVDGMSLSLDGGFAAGNQYSNVMIDPNYRYGFDDNYNFGSGSDGGGNGGDVSSYVFESERDATMFSAQDDLDADGSLDELKLFEPF